jgi:anthranilate/para-aminobenzoate synthase component I
MRALELYALRNEAGFALLGPGFGSDGAWTLVTELSPSAEGGVGVWLAAYEAAGGAAERFTGRAEAVRVAHVEAQAGMGAKDGAARPHVTLEEAGFLDGVRAIREAIAAGDVYQVNLTVRARVEGVDGAELLTRLCARGVPRFAAWVRLPDGRELVSASPELLFEVQGRTIRAEPMKGTAPAGQRAWLEASLKDRAELAMITDLVRDDLNRLCEGRSVEVSCARRLVELPYAVQAVSDVRGTLRRGVVLRDVLQQLHPGGSVTGAPREAARELISALEATPRGAYCGTLGLEWGEAARFALLIRTAERRAEKSWTYGVGAGITWDSDAAAELSEVRLKLGALGES